MCCLVKVLGHSREASQSLANSFRLASPPPLRCSFINQKRSLQLALNDFWLNTHALPSRSGEAATAAPTATATATATTMATEAGHSPAVRHIIRTKLSYIMQRGGTRTALVSRRRSGEADVGSDVDVVAYLFLIIFVKAGEIFGIYESMQRDWHWAGGSQQAVQSRAI